MDTRKYVSELIKYGRRLAVEKLICGASGNISVRCGNTFFIKVSGVLLAEAGEYDYIALDLKTGKPACQKIKKRASSESYMHLAIYKNRPDVKAVVHAHPGLATGIGCVPACSRWMDITSEPRLVLGSKVGYVKYIQPGSKTLAKKVGELVKNHNAVMLQGHGALTVGAGLKEAFYRMCVIEHAAVVYLASRVASGNDVKKTRFLSEKDIYKAQAGENAEYRRKFLRIAGYDGE